jgi:photosystem II stability/assembly factor-like uncharacterized protein
VIRLRDLPLIISQFIHTICHTLAQTRFVLSVTVRFRTHALAYGLVLLLGPVLLSCDSGSQSVVSIALHPTKPHIMYVATNDSVFKTRDRGETWTELPVFSARRVTTVVIDPKFPATLYAGTMGDAVYKSPDGGQRWLPHNVGLKEHVSFVNQFVFHPHDSRLIFAATTVGAYLTKNGARLWEERMKGYKSVNGNAVWNSVLLTPHPTDPRTSPTSAR